MQVQLLILPVIFSAVTGSETVPPLVPQAAPVPAAEATAPVALEQDHAACDGSARSVPLPGSVSEKKAASIENNRTRKGCVHKVLVVPDAGKTGRLDEKFSLRQYLLRHARPEVFNETAIRFGRNEKLHRIPGELPAGAAIPNAF